MNNPSKEILSSTLYYVSSNAWFLFFFALLFLLFPLATFAAPTDIQGFGRALASFLSGTIVTFLFGLALLIFIYNVIRFFILDNDAYSERAKAKRYMIWSISAFVLMVSIWGVVNMFVNGLGFSRNVPICPDSIPPGECRSWATQQ